MPTQNTEILNTYLHTISTFQHACSSSVLQYDKNSYTHPAKLNSRRINYPTYEGNVNDFGLGCS